MYGVVTTDAPQQNSTHQLRVALSSRSPPSSVLIFYIPKPTLSANNTAGYETGFVRAYGHYLYHPEDTKITIAAFHNEVSKTLTNVSFASGGTTEVKHFYLKFLEMQMMGRYMGEEKCNFSYDDFIQQTPMMIMDYDESESNLMNTARTGLVTSELTINITHSGTHTFVNNSRICVIAMVDEYLRCTGPTGLYQVVTAEEVLVGGFLRSGESFAEQNAGGVARTLGFDTQLQALEAH